MLGIELVQLKRNALMIGSGQFALGHANWVNRVRLFNFDQSQVFLGMIDKILDCEWTRVNVLAIIVLGVDFNVFDFLKSSL